MAAEAGMSMQPLGVEQPNPTRTRGPFMLEFASRLRCASRSFGGLQGAHRQRQCGQMRHRPQTRRLKGVKVEQTADAATGSKVQRVIEDALRAAGLTK